MTSVCPHLKSIELNWHRLTESKRFLTKDVDLVSEDRDDADIYSLTSSAKLSDKGKLDRIRSKWPKVPEIYRKAFVERVSREARG